MIQQMRESFLSACEKLECELIEMDGEEDHVHLLIAYPPKLAISVMVKNLKALLKISVKSILFTGLKQLNFSVLRFLLAFVSN